MGIASLTRTALDKMGYKPGMSGFVRNRPEELAALLPLSTEVLVPYPNLLIGFVSHVADVKPVLEHLQPLYARGERLWLCYPKKSGAIVTDIDRDRGWNALAEQGFIGVAQISLDQTWSALRFRYRDEVRKLTRSF